MTGPLARLLRRGGDRSSQRSTSPDQPQPQADSTTDLLETVARQTEAIKELQQRDREVRQRLRDLRRDVSIVQASLAADCAHPWPLDPVATSREHVNAHVATALGNAVVHTSPMPHVVIEHLLPEVTYRALLEAIPPDEFFSERDPVKQNFRPSQHKVKPMRTVQMWDFMEAYVIPRLLVPTLMARFREPIEHVYADRYLERGPAVAALPHEATAGRLMLRRPGYHLEPHLDPKRVIVTCLIYLAHPGDDAAFGTQFFSVNEPPRVDKSKTYYPRQKGYTCTLEKTLPFTSNTAVAFLNAGAAAHGATIPAEAPPDTRRHAYQFYISPDTAGLSALTGEPADDSEA